MIFTAFRIAPFRSILRVLIGFISVACFMLLYFFLGWTSEPFFFGLFAMVGIIVAILSCNLFLPLSQEYRLILNADRVNFSVNKVDSGALVKRLCDFKNESIKSRKNFFSNFGLAKIIFKLGRKTFKVPMIWTRKSDGKDLMLVIEDSRFAFYKFYVKDIVSRYGRSPVFIKTGAPIELETLNN